MRPGWKVSWLIEGAGSLPWEILNLIKVPSGAIWGLWDTKSNKMLLYNIIIFDDLWSNKETESSSHVYWRHGYDILYPSLAMPRENKIMAKEKTVNKRSKQYFIWIS